MLQTTEIPQHDIPVDALLDSGCTGSCIDEDFVQHNSIPTRPTALPVPVCNADGTPNATGSIMKFADVSIVIGDHQERIALAVVKLGTTPMFIGHEWLCFHNLYNNWSALTVTLDCCPKLCQLPHDDTDDDDDQELLELVEEDHLFALDWQDYLDYGVQLCASATYLAGIALDQAKKVQTFNDRVPLVYLLYGITPFLHQKEGWITSTGAELSKTQWHDCEEMLSVAVDSETIV